MDRLDIESLNEAEYQELQLWTVLKRSRDTNHGLTISDVAAIIKSVFDEIEVKSLVRELTK